jgi:hypothetical protein
MTWGHDVQLNRGEVVNFVSGESSLHRAPAVAESDAYLRSGPPKRREQPPVPMFVQNLWL